MTTTTQTKPMTRQQVAASLGISTKTLTRFIKTQGIAITPRTLLKPKLASLIIQKYHGD